MMRSLKSNLLLPAAVATALMWATLPVVATEPSATRTHHVHLAVPHIGEAIKWYTEYLECEPVAGQDQAIRCGNMNIEFVARSTLGSSQGTGINHIAFSYADVAAKMAQLEAVGVRGSGVRLQRFDDGATLEELPELFVHGFVFDPWGTRIELLQDPDAVGFHHVHLQSADPAATRAWYAANLGGTPASFKGTLDGVRFGDVWLLVDQYAEGTPAATAERAIDHLSFVVKDVSGAVAQLRTGGTSVADAEVPERARNASARRAQLTGPDGVSLTLVEPGWAGVAPAQATVAAAPAVAAAPYKVPRTPWGEPDFQGIWTGNSAHGIPLERPEDAALDTGALSTEDAAARRERGTLGSIWGYEREWRDTTLGYDKAAPSTQVAMIVDPPDGRMPPMTEHGAKVAAAAEDARAYYQRLPAGPEDLTNYVRCITRGLPSLMMPSIYNNGLQISQSPGYVAIQKEMIHETRIVPTTPRDHLSPNLKQWLGNSRGHWEGDTLVVEVRGFNGRADYQGSGENLTLTERYRRVGPSKLEYSFTVNDPTIWTSAWTGMFHFDLDDAQYDLVEYACHEGNYGMTNILSAARAQEQRNSEPAGD